MNFEGEKMWFLFWSKIRDSDFSQKYDFYLQFFNKSPIRALPAYKYLGVTLDKKLTFGRHITCIQHSFGTKVEHPNSLNSAEPNLNSFINSN